MAVYVRSTITSQTWSFSTTQHSFELSWVRVGKVYIAALYHTPKPTYSPSDLLEYTIQYNTIFFYYSRRQTAAKVTAYTMTCRPTTV